MLDTHVAIWAVAGRDRIDPIVLDLIADRTNEVFVSVVSLWEIAIKHAVGRVHAIPFSARAALPAFEAAGFAVLNVSAAHVLATEALPAVHADPFDRLLLAQAIEERMRLVTADRKLHLYGDEILKT